MARGLARGGIPSIGVAGGCCECAGGSAGNVAEGVGGKVATSTGAPKKNASTAKKVVTTAKNPLRWCRYDEHNRID